MDRVVLCTDGPRDRPRTFGRGAYNLQNISAALTKIISSLPLNVVCKNIIDKDTFYNTKIPLYSFTWAGLAAFHKPSTI